MCIRDSGETLQMSDFLLRQYLKVARTAVDRATFPEERPEPETFTLKQQRGRAKNFSIQANDPDRDYVVLTRNDERAPGDPRDTARAEPPVQGKTLAGKGGGEPRRGTGVEARARARAKARARQRRRRRREEEEEEDGNN